MKEEVKKEEVKINKNVPLISDFNVIVSPIITEKTMFLSKKKKVTFKVNMNVNKITVKKAIERLFNVKVKKISICNVHSKIKTRGGRFKGRTNNYKKAIATISSGNINFFEESNE